MGFSRGRPLERVGAAPRKKGQRPEKRQHPEKGEQCFQRRKSIPKGWAAAAEFGKRTVSKMRVLILSCNTGEGHNAAGKAVLERVIAEGHEAVMEDIMMMAGKRTSRIVGGTYVGIVQHMPHFFQLLYKAGSRISSPARKSPVYWANTFMAKHLSRYLEENHFDIIVTPHLFPAETMTYMKKHNMLKQKVVAIATDYTCIPFWEETNCDYYILPHPDLVEEYAEKGIPREKLIPFGIPEPPQKE